MTSDLLSSPWLSGLRGHWQRLAAREQTLVLTACAVVALALLWWVGVAPALKVLQQTGARQRSLDLQLQQMQGLAAQVQALQARPVLKYDDAVRALEASVKDLGPGARLTMAGDRATVTLKSVPASALAPWLAQARVNARALPAEVRLVRAAVPSAPAPVPPSAPGMNAPALAAASPSAGPALASWDGTLVLALPPH